ncbi:DUF302 domain-containing protein [bacterium SCSIO 12696]|nr:DUF302 domain-containing protein [bacterium SCSIO 12696]
MTRILSVKSQNSHSETAERFQNILDQKGLKTFARVNHSAGAASVGESLNPTELFIFGNPALGTPLMKADQMAALDLPQKVLIHQNDTGEVLLSYDDPAQLLEKHQLAQASEVVKKIQGALAGLTAAAAALP